VIYGPIQGMVEPADNGNDPDENRIYFYFIPLVNGS